MEEDALDYFHNDKFDNKRDRINQDQRERDYYDHYYYSRKNSNHRHDYRRNRSHKSHDYERYGDNENPYMNGYGSERNNYTHHTRSASPHNSRKRDRSESFTSKKHEEDPSIPQDSNLQDKQAKRPKRQKQGYSSPINIENVPIIKIPLNVETRV